MSFIPHVKADVEAMLQTIGIASTADLFSDIPAELRCEPLQTVPEAINEMQLQRLLQQRLATDVVQLSFLGAGAYEHHIPAAVWDIASRGEFMTAYTPYQAEASQGTLQLLYEFQTMICELTAMQVANASLYDGAQALAESILMAVRLKKTKAHKRILLPATLHPLYRQAVTTLVGKQDVELVTVPYAADSGTTTVAACDAVYDGKFDALVIPQPNFFGGLEQVNQLTEWAHTNGLLVIAVVNPTALALLQPPGTWTDCGADIVCGEGQPLGVPLASGGPYYGFMACKKADVRQMPGRIVGRTEDKQGRPGFTLTLQAREQHIRRSKATSNICTNQGLLVTASTIYLSLLGVTGLTNVATTCHANTLALRDELCLLATVRQRFQQLFFHELVLDFGDRATSIAERLSQQGILLGYPLAQHYPELSNCYLLCATETKTTEDIARLKQALQQLQ